ncbi:MAG TPA: hypothetical protein VKX96_17110 [Chloroflexota bacterium]|nr:hypothetical protein [Chloroflexota bacterium]
MLCLRRPTKAEPLDPLGAATRQVREQILPGVNRMVNIAADQRERRLLLGCRPVGNVRRYG